MMPMVRHTPLTSITPDDIAVSLRPIRTELRRLHADLASFQQRFAATRDEVARLRATVEALAAHRAA
jgi:hypothetical protein